jgi:hypothetical protein
MVSGTTWSSFEQLQTTFAIFFFFGGTCSGCGGGAGARGGAAALVARGADFLSLIVDMMMYDTVSDSKRSAGSR